MDTIYCAACLSIDRNMVEVKEITYLVDNWCDFSLKITERICWECKARFDKIWLFKQQVLRAQDILLDQYNKDNKHKSLSNLSTNAQNIVYTYVYKENDVQSDYSDDNCADVVPKREPYSMENESEVLYIKVEKEEVKESKRKRKQEPEDVRIKRESNKKYVTVRLTEEDMLKARENERSSQTFVDSKYKCVHCLYVFDRKSQLDTHSRIHSVSRGDHVCSICYSYFQTTELLQKHNLKHYTQYKCQNCNHVASDRNDILEHYRDTHKENEIACKKCKVVLSSYQERYDHCMMSHKSVYPCNVCPKYLSSDIILEKHLLKHNPQYEKPTYNCDYCHRVFHKKSTLESHIRHHSETLEKAYCVECNRQFKNETTYRVHLKQSLKHMQPENFKYECKECDKKFYCITTHRRHMNAKHYNIMDFSCDYCPKSFIRRDQLSKHIMYTHQGVSKPKDFICPHCGKGFHKKQTLLNHIRTHTGEKPFQCKLCEACFAQKTSLTTHVKSIHMKMPRKPKFAIMSQ